MSMPNPENHHQVKPNLCKPLNLRTINETMLDFWHPYLNVDLEFNVTISESVQLKIEPYFGLIFNEYDIAGQSYFLDLDFGGQENVTVSVPRALIGIILGGYLDPLLPEHFDDLFVCSMLEMILVDLLAHIKETTGIDVHFLPFSGAKGNFRSQWRIYVNDQKIIYPILIVGANHVVKGLLDQLFVKAIPKPTYQPVMELKIFSMMRKMSVSQLRSLKLGEIIILMTKRHPINEPLVIIGNKIILHTVLKGMALHLTQDPSLIQDVEELHMTVQDNDIDAVSGDNDAPPSNEGVDTDSSSENTASSPPPPEKPKAMPQSQGSKGDKDKMPVPESELDAALNDYKVTVTFELGRLETPASILSKMTKGSVLNLQKEITEDIFLTVSGRTIAIGEVVQVGRNFGVLIKEVFNG